MCFFFCFFFYLFFLNPGSGCRSLAEHERTLRDLLGEIAAMKQDLRASSSDRDR